MKAAFVGDVLAPDEITSFGPLQLTWMDDPSGCRRGALPYYAPVAPPSNPHIIGNNIFDHVKESLYCSGDEYDPAPLPIESPAPSLSPTISNRPTPKPTLSPIQTSQLLGLRSFYESINMAIVSSPSHNWFAEPGDTDYCNFTGIECGDTGFVTSISLVNMNLSGTLPASALQPLRKLSKIKLVGNKISGPFPDFSSMPHLSVIELAMNKFTGTIPESIGDSRKLRRLLIQSNQLQGTLPPSLCRLSQTLTVLDVSKNPLLFGEIPQCYGDLNLTIFRVESVGLIGSVPHGLCGTRNINGIDPNPFGCDAIACPAGTYQPVSGRQTSDDTPCLQCKTTSNIIGSKVCQHVDGNKVITLTPTQSPMPSTSVIATSTPTQAPSSNLTASDSILEENQDSVPKIPFQSSEHFVDFALRLDSIPSLMQDQETIAAYKNVTRDFIEATMSPNVEGVKVSISSIVILSQFLEAPWNHSSVLVLNSTNSTPFDRLLERTNNENSSNGAADKEGLTVSMRISGAVAPSEAPPGFSFPETMLRGFSSNMTLYLSALADSSQFFAVSTNRLAAINAPIDNEAENNNDNGRLYLGVLIPLIVVGCIVIAFLLLKKNTSRSLHVETYDASGPLSMMPSGSSLEEQFNDCEDPDQTSPPPPPPNHLSHCVDVHHCASSTCSSCHMSSNSSVMFVSVDDNVSDWLGNFFIGEEIFIFARLQLNPTHARSNLFLPSLFSLCVVCRTVRFILKMTITPSVASPMIHLKGMKVGLHPQTKVSSGERLAARSEYVLGEMCLSYRHAFSKSLDEAIYYASDKIEQRDKSSAAQNSSS